MDQFSVAARYTSSDSGSHHKGLHARLCVVGGKPVAAYASLTVGSGIVQELLKEGAVVVAPLKTQEDVERLLSDCEGLKTERLFPSVIDIATEEGCAKFVEDLVAEHGAPDHAVSIFGHFWQAGLLSEQPLAEFNKVVAETAAAHFVFVKHMAPVLKQSASSSILFVSNGAGKMVISNETSLYTVASAAIYGVILAVQAEYEEQPFRVTEMRLYAMFKRASDRQQQLQGFLWPQGVQQPQGGQDGG
ncbi:hypothetical protein CHLNCDRAFT_58857 [Chlorella variabilis]|uniref:Uncharacterized protein n=1 Tax=Chlorella variabilis TaxID=554065 RepID=E1ZP62_CHLVA|nr:hypothetical protein CHLNCDRAFT_58857 [Chlorella variabilis]EFN52484.1 hypothetical protein CHLNCDRAFT_58857 [Chlorella variabilis]|eukprot:XP_005844586.1 hypothetical protein CHLNCDRAFT_58857 [Chlorella variabilis]